MEAGRDGELMNENHADSVRPSGDDNRAAIAGVRASVFLPPVLLLCCDRDLQILRSSVDSQAAGSASTDLRRDTPNTQPQD